MLFVKILYMVYFEHEQVRVAAELYLLFKLGTEAMKVWSLMNGDDAALTILKDID